MDSDAPADTGSAQPRGQTGRWVLRVAAGLALFLAAGFILLNSPIGKRFISDQVASVAPASGLRFEVGRIEGDLFGKAVLHDVVVLDPKGAFLTIPRVELDWKPLRWFTSGLDVRQLVARRGRLLRLPELLPGDPDAPILPDFDIRVDRFEIDRLQIARGLVGDGSPQVNLLARADVRSGRVYLSANGRMGERDSLQLLVDAEPDLDRFDLDLDYRAPAGGVVASLFDTGGGYRARIRGDGSWQKWNGAALVERNGARAAAFLIGNRNGQYTLHGQAYPGGIARGLAARALGKALLLRVTGTIEESAFSGRAIAVSDALALSGRGAVDLAAKRFEDVAVTAVLRDPQLFGQTVRVEGARLGANVDGAFDAVTFDHRLAIARIDAGAVRLGPIEQKGVARYDGARWTLPLDTRIARVVSGEALLDPRLEQGRITGTLVLEGSRLASDRLLAAFRGGEGRFAFRGDLARGGYGLAGPVYMRGMKLETIGDVSGSADIVLRFGNVPWQLEAELGGRVAPVTNATIANLAGPVIRFSGGVTAAASGPLAFRNARLDASRLTLALDGSMRGSLGAGETRLAGRGRQADYGPFTVSLARIGGQNRAELVFADPYPAAGLSNVRVALAPSTEGFAIDTSGQSMLGPFDGALELVMPEAGPTRLSISRLDVWRTRLRGNLSLADGGANGALVLSGGGLDGSIGLATRAGGQGFSVEIAARDARFGGKTPLTIARANIEGSGYLKDGKSTVEGNALAEGIGYGALFIGRLAASAELENGRGTVTGSLTGRRGSQFALQSNAVVTPSRVALAAQGSFAGRSISLPRRAVFERLASGAWELKPAQLLYGGGKMLASGRFGDGSNVFDLGFDRLPLSLVDVVLADLGLGGTISGEVKYRTNADGPPTGSARVKVSNLTRSGLLLTSRPIDLALVANLTSLRLDARAVIDEGTAQRGRVQARISGLQQSGALDDRLFAGDLFAQLRFDGPGEALWRLAAVDAFDLTGPVNLAANVTGSLNDPRVRGSLASDSLRVQSALSGTDIRDVSARGSFSGSQLRLSTFAGTAANGGKVSGSGTIGFLDLASRGPRLDLKIAAANAQLVNARGLSATVTGPLRIVSDGRNGTIAGRVTVNRASWRLGRANAVAQLPQIRTSEINLPFDRAPPRVRATPWRYLVDARAPNGIEVDGMGLESEWEGNIQLRGTTADPRIGGEARVVRGDYVFAGSRFELTRGRITFDASGPIDPRLDIAAESDRDGLEVTVRVQGNALQPEISFSSIPALPEEELLARLLFGGSITELSATDALQLGSALASLRGGAGLDPINQLRSAIGLDRLRIVSADPAIGRETGVALGKNIGRRFYVELVTDGRGYSATEAEFRITGWLSLLATVSTAGRNSVVAEISRDY